MDRRPEGALPGGDQGLLQGAPHCSPPGWISFVTCICIKSAQLTIHSAPDHPHNSSGLHCVRFGSCCVGCSILARFCAPSPTEGLERQLEIGAWGQGELWTPSNHSNTFHTACCAQSSAGMPYERLSAVVRTSVACGGSMRMTTAVPEVFGMIVGVLLCNKGIRIPLA